MSSSDSEREELLPPVKSTPAEAGYDGDGKSPQQIEGDISETRAQLGEILDELERKLAPRQLLERGVDMLKDTMSGEGSGLGETLRSNPIPLALIGIGIGWMVMGNTARGRLGEYGDALRDRVSDAVHGASDRASALAGQVRDKVSGLTAGSAADEGPDSSYSTVSAGYAYARQKSGSVVGHAQDAVSGAQDALQRTREVGSAAWQRAGDYVGQAGDQLYDARDRFSRLIEDHPLTVGALGFLAGSVLAYMLPRTDVEDRFIEPVGEGLRDQAAGFGREAAERAQRVAERTVDAATEAIKDAVAEVGDAAAGKGEHEKEEEKPA